MTERPVISFYGLADLNRRETRAVRAKVIAYRAALPALLVGFLGLPFGLLAALLAFCGGLLLGALPAAISLARSPKPERVAADLGARPVQPGEAQVYLDAVAEYAIASGLPPAAALLVDERDVAVLALGKPGASTVIASRGALALPDAELRAAVCHAYARIGGGGYARAARLLAARDALGVGAIAKGLLASWLLAGPLILLVAITAVQTGLVPDYAGMAISAGSIEMPVSWLPIPVGIVLWLFLPIALAGVAIGASPIFVPVVIALSVLVRRAAAQLSRGWNELTDAVAVEIGRDPGALEALLARTAMWECLPAVFDDPLTDLLGVVDPATSGLRDRVNALRALRSLPPRTDLANTAPGGLHPLALRSLSLDERDHFLSEIARLRAAAAAGEPLHADARLADILERVGGIKLPRTADGGIALRSATVDGVASFTVAAPVTPGMLWLALTRGFGQGRTRRDRGRQS